MKKFIFKYKNKKFEIEVLELKTFFSKFMGLMFKKNSKPLLFIFEKEKIYPIHSFFCKPFIAIWFNNKKIVDVKIINDWKFYIKPKDKSNLLLEIPINYKYHKIIEEILSNKV